MGLALSSLLYSINYFSVLMTIPHCFVYYNFVTQFETVHNASSFVLLSQDFFGYSEFFVVPNEFHDCFVSPIYVNDAINVGRNCHKYVYCLGEYGHFNNINYSNPLAKNYLSIYVYHLPFLSAVS